MKRYCLLLILVLGSMVACSDEPQAMVQEEAAQVIPSATPTVTPSATPTETPSATPTATATPTETPTPTPSPTATPTFTPSPTPTPAGGRPYLLVPRLQNSEDVGADTQLFWVSSDGSEMFELVSAEIIEQLTEKPVARLGRVTTSPDGRHAVVGICNEVVNNRCTSGEVDLLDLESLRLIRLDDQVDGGRMLLSEWSPDGSRALMQVSYGDSAYANNELFIVEAENGKIRNITNSPELDQTAYWAGNSDRIIWNIFRQGNWMMNADGSDAQSLDIEAVGNRPIMDLSYTADGDLAAFILLPPEVDGYSSLWIVETETGEAWQIIDGILSREVVWSPDGSRLMLVRFDHDSGTWQHLFLDAQTGEATEIALPPQAKVCGWSPDGRQLFYLDAADYENVKLLSLADPAGTPRKLTSFTEEPRAITGSNQFDVCPVWP